MKIYLVGGAVRDELLGLKPTDKDYVVVGSTPEQMLSLGFTQVGNTFPVFLHPITKEEYALARTEKKNGVGYQGFDCYFGAEITLEEDLSRRDLTINAIAKDLETGEYVDPFGGIQDIKNKILRATTEHFKDDPLRCLRLMRFRAKPGDAWKISSETQKYWDELYYKEELKYLNPERVWLETSKALGTKTPSLYFSGLSSYDLFPEFNSCRTVEQPKEHHPEGNVFTHTNMVMDYAAQNNYSKYVIFSCFCHDMGKVVAYEKQGNLYGHEDLGVVVVESLCSRFKIPNTYKELALLVTQYHTHCHKAFEMKPKTIMKLFDNTRAIQKPERFIQYLEACLSDAKGRGEPKCSEQYHQHIYLKECLDAVLKVNTKEIANNLLTVGKTGIMIGEEIRISRINAIRGVKNKWKNYKSHS